MRSSTPLRPDEFLHHNRTASRTSMRYPFLRSSRFICFSRSHIITLHLLYLLRMRFHATFVVPLPCVYARPYTSRPEIASTLRPQGRGLPVLIARGRLLPASTTLASSASSTP
jgi:hypothetical protein